MNLPAKPASAVHYLTIDDAHSGQRLDNFLLSHLKGVPKTHIYRILRKGEVRINKGRSSPDYRLQVGDVVRVPPVRTPQRAAERVIESAGTGGFAWLGERVLYEDDSFLAIDKPAGLAAHGGSGISFGLIEALRQLRPEARFLELVHRLDRETSGCLLVAKKRAALVALHAMLREEGLDKRYLALVQGAWAGKARRVEAPLEKFRLQSGERMVSVSETGKESASRFIPKRIYAGATLVEIKLLTGRTHQARVHATHLGHPIAGDAKYGNKEFNRAMRERGLNRLFLHAAELRFKHPLGEEQVHIRAPLPLELQALLNRLGNETK